MSDVAANAVTGASAKSGGVLTIPREATVREAAALMCGRKVGALVVTDQDGRVVGIVSERDLVRRVLSTGGDVGSVLVQDVMTPEPLCCLAGTTLGRAQEMMMSWGVRHLPVVDESSRAVGMISSRDVMAHQVKLDRAMRAAAEQVAMLSTSLKSLDFDEVVQLVTHDVPRIFDAAAALLFFAGPKSKENPPLLVMRHKCRCPEGAVLERSDVRAALGGGRVLCSEPPGGCPGQERPCPSLLIPLEVGALGSTGLEGERTSQGFLCMCEMDALGEQTHELPLYKASLIRNVLNSNLTNARQYQQAKHAALTDPLTGTGSRRLFDERLEEELIRSNRFGGPVCVAMLDLDNFRDINEQGGHGVGDEMLRAFGHLLKEEKRATDVLSRYGGDEFALLMPETTVDGAVAMAERIRERTERITRPDGLRLTVSCGVAEYSPKLAVPGALLVRRADLALYEAKRAGRNRVETWGRVAKTFESNEGVDQAGIGMLQARLEEMSRQSKDVFVQSVWGLVQALEARDPYTKSHSENVKWYSVGIAEGLGVDGEGVGVIRRAAMIHDIGKIGVPDHILRKPGPLTEEERRIMERHPLIGAGILDRMRFLERELPIVRHHHERWDGGGYPGGLSAERIPRGARILAVADAFDAMTSDRVYRRAKSVAQTLDVLMEGAGAQFDPQVVEAMLEWVRRLGQAIGKGDNLSARDLLEVQKARSAA